MGNPFRVQTPTVTVIRKCATCRDMGYLLPSNAETAHVPAAVLYADGVPCGCPAGEVFRWMAEEWAKPIPGGKHA